MGERGVDVETLRYAIECTNRESLNLWAKIEQSERNALQKKKIPILVIKRNRSNVYGVLDWKLLVSLLALFDGQVFKDKGVEDADNI